MIKLLQWFLNLFKLMVNSLTPEEQKQQNELQKTVVMTSTVPLQSPTVPVQQSSAPTAVLTRISDNGVETLGLLVASYNGQTFSCSTLELPWKDNQHDISCVPKGTYQCEVKPFHSTQRYELQNTAPRTGIFVHEGNYYKDVLGCILLGVSPLDINGDGQIDVTNSVNTIAKFMDFFHNEPFTLIIK